MNTKELTKLTGQQRMYRQGKYGHMQPVTILGTEVYKRNNWSAPENRVKVQFGAGHTALVSPRDVHDETPEQHAARMLVERQAREQRDLEREQRRDRFNSTVARLVELGVVDQARYYTNGYLQLTVDEAERLADRLERKAS